MGGKFSSLWLLLKWHWWGQNLTGTLVVFDIIYWNLSRQNKLNKKKWTKEWKEMKDSRTIHLFRASNSILIFLLQVEVAMLLLAGVKFNIKINWSNRGSSNNNGEILFYHYCYILCLFFFPFLFLPVTTDNINLFLLLLKK